MDEDVAFDARVTTSDWQKGDPEVELETGQGATTGYETLHFTVALERDPMYATLALVIPTLLLNIISFAQFWIPSSHDSINLDRGGMAITTILAALAIRETSLSEVDTAFTMLDVFLLVSLLFHFIGFIITAFESSHAVLKKQKGFGIGSADHVGKAVLPTLFGVINMVLSIVWPQDGLFYTLFVMSLLVTIVALWLNRKESIRTVINRRRNESIRKSVNVLGLEAHAAEHVTDELVLSEEPLEGNGSGVGSTLSIGA